MLKFKIFVLSEMQLIACKYVRICRTLTRR